MTDKQSIVHRLGGPTAVAKKYGFNLNNVLAWVRRGIPAKHILKNQQLADDIKALKK